MGQKSELDPRAIDEASSEISHAPPEAAVREAAELELRMLEEARSEVVTADQKASMILAAAGIGFAAVLGGLLRATGGQATTTLLGSSSGGSRRSSPLASCSSMP